METAAGTTIRRELDALKPYLGAFVSQHLQPGAGVRVESDVAGLLNAVLANWETVFSKVLTRKVRSYFFELKDVRSTPCVVLTRYALRRTLYDPRYRPHGPVRFTHFRSEPACAS